MANLMEILSGAAVIGGMFSLTTEAIKVWLARRNKADEAREKSESLAIEAKKAEDEFDAKLIASLLEERREQNARITALEKQVTDERISCEAKMDAMRKEYQQQIAELRAEIRELQKRAT